MPLRLFDRQLAIFAKATLQQTTYHTYFAHTPLPLPLENPTACTQYYRKTSNIRDTLVCNKIVDHSDVVGASPVGAAPTTSSFSTWHLASRESVKKAARQYENLLSVGIWCVLY